MIQTETKMHNLHITTNSKKDADVSVAGIYFIIIDFFG